MDFFAAQERARRRSRWLLVALAASVLSIAALLYGVVAYVAQTTETGSWLMPDVFVTILGAVAAVVGLGFLFKLIGLRAGGERVAEWLGGTLVERSTSAPDERQLINIVEEMAIASVPVPPCYVLEDEASINAFAAGYQAEDAIVAVTRGALDQLATSFKASWRTSSATCSTAICGSIAPRGRGRGSHGDRAHRAHDHQRSDAPFAPAKTAPRRALPSGVSAACSRSWGF